jgi:hypothetical protein
VNTKILSGYILMKFMKDLSVISFVILIFYFSSSLFIVIFFTMI